MSHISPKQIIELGIDWRSKSLEYLRSYAQRWVLTHPASTKRAVFDKMLKVSFWGADTSTKESAEAIALSKSFSFMAQFHKQKQSLVGNGSFADACKASDDIQKLMNQVKFQIASVRTLAMQLPMLL